MSLEKAKEDFEKSIIIAREAGVPEDQILQSKSDIDNFFMGPQTEEKKTTHPKPN